MTSIDELFKKSGIPSKRKLEPARDPSQIYKSVRLSANGGGSRHAHIDPDDDIEAGPARPPQEDDEDGDYGPAVPPLDDEEQPGDDEEGRFFGGGISKKEANILDYVEGQGDDATNGKKGVTDSAEPALEVFDIPWMRRTAVSFEKRINRNAELRARYESEPARFISSEADLDAEIKALSILGEHPDLYPEFVRLGSLGSLVSLLAHENTDIAISAIEIIGELTDEDVDATDAEWNALVRGLLEADLIGLLVSNLERLKEDDDEADRTGVYYALGIVENLCSSARSSMDPREEDGNAEVGEVLQAPEDSTRAAAALGAHAGLLEWLLKRVQRAETRPGAPAVSQNRQYAAEILAILAQAAPGNAQRMAGDHNTVDTLLQLAAAYRRSDPEKGGDEEEYMENMFEALTCLVDDDAGKEKFAEAEGVELCLLIFKDGKKSRLPALRLLDHATSGPASEATADICRRIVDAGGLKAVFTLFMRGDEKKPKKDKKDKDKKKSSGLYGPTSEHLVSILASMLRLLPADSAERIRLLAKFVEKDYEKVERLVALRREYGGRVEAVERQGREKNEVDEDEQLARRLDAGLATRQSVDIILAWLVAEDNGARTKILTALQDRDETLATLRESLQERRDGIDPSLDDGRDLRDMLSTLMDFLQ